MELFYGLGPGDEPGGVSFLFLALKKCKKEIKGGKSWKVWILDSAKFDWDVEMEEEEVVGTHGRPGMLLPGHHG